MSEALVPLQRNASELSEILSGTTEIATKEDFQVFADVLRDIKTHRKVIEEEREKVLKPQRDALAASRALFDRLDNQYEEAEKHIKLLIADYTVREQAEERKRLSAALESGDARVAVDLASQAAPVAQGVSTREKFSFVIENPSLVPDEHWVIDEKRIGALVRAAKGAIVIPGVRVVVETTVSARSK